MEIISIEQLMKDKLAECDAWLGEKDHAVEELALAKEAVIKAEAKVAEYTEENIVAVEKYRDDLKARLGIVDKVEDVVVEEVAVVEPVEEKIIPTPIVVGEPTTDEIVEMPLLAR